MDIQSLWDGLFYYVWIPDLDIFLRLHSEKVKPLDSTIALINEDKICYLAAASRISDALSQDVLLAPMESSVIPLPHQMRALSRALSNDKIRYLLADEVGLGKTIEAGLIMKELKLRGLVKRTLIITPRGLVKQWIAEMLFRFGEDFKLLIPADFPVYRRIIRKENIWFNFDQVICSIDSIKPLTKRSGWTNKQIAEYNRERFEDIISAGWDLVIVDEAHKLGGTTEQVARHKLGQGLAEAVPYILLLSATPHQGKTDAFRRLVSLLDLEAFPDDASVSRERVEPYVIRTEKRRAIDAQGKQLFKPRKTQLLPVSWKKNHQEQHLLYEAVTEYVRMGYNRAVKEKKSYIGFLMVLMQRLVTSSTRAIRATLERRLQVLESPGEQLSLFPEHYEEEWNEMEGDEQVETYLKAKLTALKNEREEVKLLLTMAKKCEIASPDAKAEEILELIYKLQREEGNPDLKILVFTEFIPTQEMLYSFLTDRGFSVVCLNGTMGIEEREKAQEEFAKKLQIMVSTDAGGEGLNLQFCHIVINYDIPWNPMRLEQRIGRLDRIGQNYIVRAINFVFENTVEHRVREVLEQKLSVIFKEFGIDKTGDVLDSSEAGKIFDDLFLDVILNPENLDTKVDDVIKKVQEQIQSAKENLSVLGESDELNHEGAQQLLSHPLPHWVEQMTVSYLKACGGKAEKSNSIWNLFWPNGTSFENVVFSRLDGEKIPGALHLTLENPHIRGLVEKIPQYVIGQPIPIINMPSIPTEIKGIWSLWKVSIHAEDWNRHKIMPHFLHDDGRYLYQTSRLIWDQMLTNTSEICNYLDSSKSCNSFVRIQKSAELQGKPVYEKLQQEHQKLINREKEKGEYTFKARRNALQRIGLPAVRQHRINQLDKEEQAWREKLKKRMIVNPELIPLILIRIEENDN